MIAKRNNNKQCDDKYTLEVVNGMLDELVVKKPGDSWFRKVGYITLINTTYKQTLFKVLDELVMHKPGDA